MASNAYGFEAAPRVVHNKPKFNKRSVDQSEEGSEAGNPAGFNIMFDKRVFRGNTHAMHLVKKLNQPGGQPTLSPQQKDDMRVAAEKERKKVEMIKQQLVAFSTNRSKQTPYDLRPGPPARIEVDLEPFLTEQITEPIMEENQEVQCDEFIPKPSTPEYVPKKRGMDNWTQVQDYDLFDYDIEVIPILNVLVNKTLEQAQLEVEEDAEIASIRRFKSEYAERRSEERDEWARAVHDEIKLLKEKNLMRERARKIKEQQIKTLAKVQEMAIAKRYLKGLFGNVVMFLNDHSFWRDSKEDELNISYRNYLQEKVEQKLGQREVSQQVVKEMFGKLIGGIYQEREKLEQIREQKVMEKAKRRMIEHPERRFIYFFFNNEYAQIVETQFAKRLDMFLNGSLLKWEQEHTLRVKDYQEKIDGGGEYDDPKEVPTTYDPVSLTKLLILNIERFKSVSLSLTINPFFPVAQNMRYFTPFAVAYNKQGMCVGRVGDGLGALKGVEYQDNIRDSRMRINDDQKVTVDLSKLGAEVTMVLFVVGLRLDSEKRPLKKTGISEKDFEHARWRLLENQTGQQFQEDGLMSSFGVTMPPQVGGSAPAAQGGEEGGAPIAEATEVKESYLIVGRIFKQDMKPPPPPGRASAVSPSVSPPPQIGAQASEQSLVIDPIGHSSFIMQSPSLVAGVFASKTEQPSNTSQLLQETSQDPNVTENLTQQKEAVPTISSVQPLPSQGWYFEAIRHKIEGPAPPQLPEIGLPGQGTIDSNIDVAPSVPPIESPIPTVEREGPPPDWFEQIGNLAMRIQMTPMPIWQRGDGDQESAFGGKSAKGKKGKKDKKKEKKKAKKSEMPETPVEDSSNLGFDLLSPAPPQEDEYTKFLKMMSGIACAALGPFDLDCTIDLPPKAELSVMGEQSFIAMANASIHETEEEKGEFLDMFKSLLQQLASGGSDELQASSHYGYNVTVNKRNLRRGKQVLKHGFDFTRLQITPIPAPPPVIEVELEKLEASQEEQNPEQ